MRILIAALLLGPLLPPGIAQAAESYDGCTGYIDSLPAVVTSPGTWCLRSDLSTRQDFGAAITLAANNITLDCNGFKVGGLASGAGTYASGINADDRSGVTVRNCVVRGFIGGVIMSGTNGVVIEDNRLDGNTAVGMQIYGDGILIRDNVIRNIGGSTINPYSSAGIVTVGSGDILGNQIVRLRANSPGASLFGIDSAGYGQLTISGNIVRDLVHGGEGSTYGIRTGVATGGLARGNTLDGSQQPGSFGILCLGQMLTTGNVATGHSTAFSQCASVRDFDVSQGFR